MLLSRFCLIWALILTILFLCLSQTYAEEVRLVNPNDIDLKGTTRKENISTSLGRVDLRWPRKVELLFGRTPIRAMADAARTSARFLKLAGFKVGVRNLNLDWQVVFMSEDLPTHQIPSRLVSNCHPGWMVPPAKIYIVAERVVHSCGAKSFKPGYVADADLMKVLLHEIGHAIDFQLLKMRPNPRPLAEGFASWFEQRASDYSSLIGKGEVFDFYQALARRSLENKPTFYWSGSGEDYARSSFYYHAITKRGSIAHLMDIYDYRLEGLDFFEAVKKRMGWSKQRFNEELSKAIESN